MALTLKASGLEREPPRITCITDKAGNVAICKRPFVGRTTRGLGTTRQPAGATNIDINGDSTRTRAPREAECLLQTGSSGGNEGAPGRKLPSGQRLPSPILKVKSPRSPRPRPRLHAPRLRPPGKRQANLVCPDATRCSAGSLCVPASPSHTFGGSYDAVPERRSRRSLRSARCGAIQITLDCADAERAAT